MSIAPRDIHEAQIQFALERGVPAMLGVLSTHRLPFPSRSYDMAHCSRCLVNWTRYDGLYLLEIDRVLRPGGYWVFSGPPINWKTNYIGWQKSAKELEEEQKSLEDLTKRLCWKKVDERGPIAVWQKPINHIQCAKAKDSKAGESPKFCTNTNPDAGWYEKMEACITPLPKVSNLNDVSGGAIEKWPERKYRNIMDMNAGIGGFAAALADQPVWVMNVVPFDAEINTFGVLHERGLIGTYMNWCEPFSTYPRSYDLIHADGLFGMYKDKCDILDILFEMYRIIRPEGAIIIRDDVDTVMKVKDITYQMRWKGNISESEQGSLHPKKILIIDGSV
ncbi:hypothetical protein NMG60_11028256 [Bertholletia excelsa]